MVGGGPGSFIGPVHRMAAELDRRFALVAGSFSSDLSKTRAGAAAYGVTSERAYAGYREMFAAERARTDGIEAVAIVTPNHLHLPIAVAALESGLHVLSDKPATATLAEALTLRDVVRRSSGLYGLTYTYTGYPMIREARRRVARGDVGRVRKAIVDYPQGWLSSPIERQGNKQAEWRVDPARSGLGGCIGDIGVHAFNLAEYVSGARVRTLLADLSSVVPHRVLDDDCNVLLRFDGGQPGVLTASQISTGERNGLTLRIYGETGGLHWSHADPTVLTLNYSDDRSEILHASSAQFGAAARLPTGHPQGFIEAFANIYSDFADAVLGARDLIGTVIPDIEAGVRSMRFVERAIESSRAGGRWLGLEDEVTA